MELTATLLRTAFMYVFVFLILRLMGKREIGKLSVFDMVISIMIAEIAVISIEDTRRSMWVTVGPMVVLFAIQMLLSLVLLKSRRLRLFFDGKPSVLISGGQLNWREMRRQRYNLDDLLVQLRGNRVTDIAEVELAVLEPNGKLTVLPKESAPANEGSLEDPISETAKRPRAAAVFEEAYSKESASRGDERTPAPKFRYEGLPVPLIMDGVVQEDGLAQIGRNRFWLRQELRQRGVRSFEQVFLCSLDHKGKLYVDRKS